jgi:hypothetical protein
MSADVRKALEAAVWDLPEGLQQLCALRIAAFLRAMPPGWHMDKTREEIAAAVIAATRGGPAQPAKEPPA